MKKMARASIASRPSTPVARWRATCARWRAGHCLFCGLLGAACSSYALGGHYWSPGRPRGRSRSRSCLSMRTGDARQARRRSPTVAARNTSTTGRRTRQAARRLPEFLLRNA
ncbi:unnamed protein product [Amoebophrya sp. A120]|nr:unnamed protein product [Amoebophrya sp. A120]CAD7970055.1 unnamed protein product [Amoebophrya sp. A120]|eukprot:GSA120T00022099001.1